MSGVNSHIRAMTVFDPGDGGTLPSGVVMGGIFVQAGGHPAERVALWDGSSWFPLGDGLNGSVYALTVFDADGPGGAPPRLFAGGRFTASGATPIKNLAMWDGSSWRPVADTPTGEIRAMAVSDDDGPGPLPETLVVGGLNFIEGGRAAVLARWNGLAWSDVGGEIVGQEVLALETFDPDGAGPAPRRLYAGGRFESVGGISVQNIASWDGAAWAPLTTGVDGPVMSFEVYDDDGPGPHAPALFVGGEFGLAGGLHSVEIAKWDGGAWMGFGAGFDSAVRTMAVVDEDGVGPKQAVLFAGGGFRSVPGVAGSSANCAARWNGTAWSLVGTGVIGNDLVINALIAWDRDGAGPAAETLIAGGSFSFAGDNRAGNMAVWNGTLWSTDTGPGLADLAYAMTVVGDNGPAAPAPGLYAGGAFRTAGDVTVNRIARWNGSEWFPLGAGITGARVLALGMYDDDGSGPLSPALYVGGQFTKAGPASVTGLARWNGSAWSAVGTFTGTSREVRAFAVFDPDASGPAVETLIVGGSFDRVDTALSKAVAAWDGAAWTGLGSGVQHSTPPRVSALAVFDEDGPGGATPALFAAGYFASAGGGSAANIARWNGAAWSTLGSGLSAEALAMVVHDEDGDGPSGPALFVAGAFSQAGGAPMSRIARWNGASWSPLGSGLNGNVFALLRHDPDGPGPAPAILVATGNFTSAGGAPAAGIAAWDGSTWRGLGAGLNRNGYSLAAFDDDGSELTPDVLYVSGDFNAAGEHSSEYFARWACPALPPCAADLNGDGLVDFSDYLEFLNLFNAQDPRVDFNQDGLVDFSDYLEFLNLFDAGC